MNGERIKKKMKRIVEWIYIAKTEVPPSVLSALMGLGLIFFFYPTADSAKITITKVVRMGILCLITAAASYYSAIHYQIPYPFFISVVVAFMTSPVALGLFKLSVKFSKDPEKTIKRTRK